MIQFIREVPINSCSLLCAVGNKKCDNIDYIYVERGRKQSGAGNVRRTEINKGSILGNEELRRDGGGGGR